jgi:hypothetical protein
MTEIQYPNKKDKQDKLYKENNARENRAAQSRIDNQETSTIRLFRIMSIPTTFRLFRVLTSELLGRRLPVFTLLL